MAKKTPNPVDKYVGERVRMRRMVLGMSQEKLGDAIDLTFQQVQKYEKGTNRIGASRLLQIANVLKVSPSYFFEGAPNQGKPANDAMPAFVTELLTTPSGLALAEACADVKDPKVRRAIVELVRLIGRQAVPLRRAS